MTVTFQLALKRTEVPPIFCLKMTKTWDQYDFINSHTDIRCTIQHPLEDALLSTPSVGTAVGPATGGRAGRQQVDSGHRSDVYDRGSCRYRPTAAHRGSNCSLYMCSQWRPCDTSAGRTDEQFSCMADTSADGSHVCWPQHSTRSMHPLDVSFMQSFKTYCAQEVQSWLRMKAPRVVTPSDRRLAPFIPMAGTCGCKRFHSTALSPYNRHDSDDFLRGIQNLR